MSKNLYLNGLDRCDANYAPLTPIDFLLRAASVYPDHVALIDADKKLTWSQVEVRCRRLASALQGRGIGKNETVAIIAPNSQAIYEAHFGVPMAGAVLNTINTRLDADNVAFILAHGEARVLLADAELSDLVNKSLDKLEPAFRDQLLVVDIEVEGCANSGGAITYEALLAEGDSGAAAVMPEDEWDAISLNYTSGTTGNPKGVVYHHRGAYLNALSNIVGWEMGHGAVYLWTLPMFHCNGWCFPWSLAAIAGTSVCLRNVSAKHIFAAIEEHRVTHFCGAPIIMNMVINANDEERREFDHQVEMMTAAAPPPAAVLESMENAGFKVTHVYGLTETYGPAVICAWKPQWDSLDSTAKAQVKSRQGVRYHVLQGLDVMNPETMQPVEPDGEQMGETMFRGNIVMKGYLKNPQATREAFAGGWFHSGDLGVIQPDRYLKLRDRSKDIIISGGENISSIEVEDCLYQHPQVAEAAVVAKPDDHWGETPCAFVGLKSDSAVSEKDIIDFCRDNLAHYKCPKTVVFGELPKTSTGKIQKFKLRERILDGEI
ncbi:MAG: acyl-CoA synthetase [bacterium]